MPSICFYFQVHQPFRLRNYSFFDIGLNPFYEDEAHNCHVMQKVANACYIPMNRLLLKLIYTYGKNFKVSFSISGTALEQFERYSPEVIYTFQELASTGCVEFLAETYYHSLAFMFSHSEFKEQVELHQKRITELFNITPRVFRNTELIYTNELAKLIEDMGYLAILAEGADHILHWRSPNFIYHPIGCQNLKLLLKNYRLSDDIAFRFSNKGWVGYPLTAERFSEWIGHSGGPNETINLFMDYETFGEHQWADTGIFSFMEALPHYLLSSNNKFVTPSEIANVLTPVAELDVPYPVSWADTERDLTAWTGNAMQQDAIEYLYRLEPTVKSFGCEQILSTWKKLQTSDHFYYMCTKWFSDGDVHKYFNPYSSPYDAYINYMNVLADLESRVIIQHNKNSSYNQLKHTCSDELTVPSLASYRALQSSTKPVRNKYATTY